MTELRRHPVTTSLSCDFWSDVCRSTWKWLVPAFHTYLQTSWSIVDKQFSVDPTSSNLGRMFLVDLVGSLVKGRRGRCPLIFHWPSLTLSLPFTISFNVTSPVLFTSTYKVHVQRFLGSFLGSSFACKISNRSEPLVGDDRYVVNSYLNDQDLRRGKKNVGLKLPLRSPYLSS